MTTTTESATAPTIAIRRLPRFRVLLATFGFGLVLDAAAARLRDGFASYGQGTATLTDGELRETISYADLGRRLDVDAMLEQAFAVGRTGTIAERALEEVRAAARGVVIEPMVRLDPAAVVSTISSLAGRLDRPAVDATARVTPAGFLTTDSAHGRTVGQGSTTAALVAALRDPAA